MSQQGEVLSALEKDSSHPKCTGTCPFIKTASLCIEPSTTESLTMWAYVGRMLSPARLPAAANLLPGTRGAGGNEEEDCIQSLLVYITCLITSMFHQVLPPLGGVTRSISYLHVRLVSVGAERTALPARNRTVGALTLDKL